MLVRTALFSLQSFWIWPPPRDKTRGGVVCSFPRHTRNFGSSNIVLDLDYRVAESIQLEYLW